MTENKKTAFLQAKGYSHLSNGTATATSLAPGERVLFDEANPQHKAERAMAESGDPNALFQLVEADLKAEADQEQEREEMLAEGAKIAAEQRQEAQQAEIDRQERQAELRAQAEEEGQPPVGQGADFPPQDKEAQRLAAESGAGQRATTQDDVAEEDQPKSGRRSSKKG
jgi:hypothetical protein